MHVQCHLVLEHEGRRFGRHQVGGADPQCTRPETVQSSDETMKEFLEKDQMEQLYKKLWIQAGGESEKIPSIWEALLANEPLNSADTTSEWEAPTLKTEFPKPCDWRRTEFQKLTKLVSQGHEIKSFKGDKISSDWLQYYRRIPHRKLLTALQLRANLYPTREFLSWGREENYIKACRHCDADNEIRTHIIGYYQVNSGCSNQEAQSHL